MKDLARSIVAVALLQAVAAMPALAQQFHGAAGVFEGFSGPYAGVRTPGQPDAHWQVDAYTRYSNGRPEPGDWVRVDIDPYGRAVNFQIIERPTTRTGTVDHLEGPVIVVNTPNGVEMWNDVANTWHLGVSPGGLQPGDAVDAAVYRNRNLAFVRLDGRGSAPPAPQSMSPDGGSYAMASPDGAMPQDTGDMVSAQVAPPPLPDYDVPPCPEPDFIWTPGYWRWGPVGYFWVPGVWVAAPAPGLLWTPGYWGFVGGAYIFHAGYWGPHVGFYGGIRYGGGYYGEGFVGGRWQGGHVIYNTAAVPVNTTVIHNTYVNNTVVINNQTTTISNVAHGGNGHMASFSGPGGARATPTANEQKWASQAHTNPTPMQVQHIQAARANPQLQQSFNHGAPAMLATPRIQPTPTQPMNQAARTPGGMSQPMAQPQGMQRAPQEPAGAAPRQGMPAPQEAGGAARPAPAQAGAQPHFQPPAPPKPRKEEEREKEHH